MDVPQTALNLKRGSNPTEVHTAQQPCYDREMCALPIPNAAEVDRFRKIYTERTGIILTDPQALDVCTRASALYYVKHHAWLGQLSDFEKCGRIKAKRDVLLKEGVAKSGPLSNRQLCSSELKGTTPRSGRKSHPVRCRPEHRQDNVA